MRKWVGLSNVTANIHESGKTFKLHTIQDLGKGVMSRFHIQNLPMWGEVY